MFDGRAFHSLAVVGKKTLSECVGRVSNLKKLVVMFVATGIVHNIKIIDLVGCL